MTRFKVEQPDVFDEQFDPEYLQRDKTNFKKKHAVYPESDDDKLVKEFYKEAKEKHYTIKQKVKTIYRTKRGSKDFLNYSMVLEMIDEDGVPVGKEYDRIYGCEKFPIIREFQRNGRTVREDKGIRINHYIPFNKKEIEKVIDLCDKDYKDEIKYVYNELPSDTREVVNTSRKYTIKTLDILLNATHKDLTKMITLNKNGIETLEELNAPTAPVPVVVTKG